MNKALKLIYEYMAQFESEINKRGAKTPQEKYDTLRIIYREIDKKDESLSYQQIYCMTQAYFVLREFYKEF